MNREQVKRMGTEGMLAGAGAAVLAAVGAGEEKNEKLQEAFGPVGSSLSTRDPFMSLWPISPKRLTAGLRSHERWLAAHGRGHGWTGPSCDEPHCGPRPPHAQNRASRKRMARA